MNHIRSTPWNKRPNELNRGRMLHCSFAGFEFDATCEMGIKIKISVLEIGKNIFVELWKALTQHNAKLNMFGRNFDVIGNQIQRDVRVVEGQEGKLNEPGSPSMEIIDNDVTTVKEVINIISPENVKSTKSPEISAESQTLEEIDIKSFFTEEERLEMVELFEKYKLEIPETDGFSAFTGIF